MHPQTSGAIVDYWGEGYFIGLHFTPDSDATETQVGLRPSMGSGPATLEEDGLALFKLTNISEQRIKVVSTRPGEEKVWFFEIDGLTLSDS